MYESAVLTEKDNASVSMIRSQSVVLALLRMTPTTSVQHPPMSGIVGRDLIEQLAEQIEPVKCQGGTSGGQIRNQ